jgi:hypothetical protein
MTRATDGRDIEVWRHSPRRWRARITLTLAEVRDLVTILKDQDRLTDLRKHLESIEARES